MKRDRKSYRIDVALIVVLLVISILFTILMWELIQWMN